MVDRACQVDQFPCKNCDCSHDGSVPGWDVGECNCARIGGPYISAIEHEYVPKDEYDIRKEKENAEHSSG